MTTLNETASWIIVNRSTGYPVFETFRENTANAFTDSPYYEAIPILKYLQSLNPERRQ